MQDSNGVQLASIQTKILASELFQHSKSCRALLEYLIDCSKSGITPKETTIAAEVFNKDQQFHPGEDPLVRVSIHNLRKRLQDYYNSDGKDDKYRIEIPKGQYVIRLRETKPRRNPDSKFKLTKGFLLDYRFHLILILTIVSLVLLLKYLNLASELNTYKIVDKNDLIWGNFDNFNFCDSMSNKI